MKPTIRPVYILGISVSSEYEDKEKMISYAKQLFGDRFDKANEIINCESGWQPKVKNKTSSAGGLGQFINSTWVNYRKRMGKDTSLHLKYNWIEAIETMNYAFEINGYGDWYASIGCHGIR